MRNYFEIINKKVNLRLIFQTYTSYKDVSSLQQREKIWKRRLTKAPCRKCFYEFLSIRRRMMFILWLDRNISFDTFVRRCEKTRKVGRIGMSVRLIRKRIEQRHVQLSPHKTLWMTSNEQRYLLLHSNPRRRILRRDWRHLRLTRTFRDIIPRRFISTAFSSRFWMLFYQTTHQRYSTLSSDIVTAIRLVQTYILLTLSSLLIIIWNIPKQPQIENSWYFLFFAYD